MSDQQPYRGDPRNPVDVYGGVPYLPPERVDHYHEAPASTLSRRDLAWRVGASLVLGVLALVTLVRVVHAVAVMAALSANPGPMPDWNSAVIGFAGTLVLTLLLLAYPAVNVVRWRRARR